MSIFKRYTPVAQRNRVNEQIRLPQMQVIDSGGKNQGVMRTEDALRLAREHNLDLVEIVPPRDNKPAVARIIDYGKFQYEQDKRARQARSKVKAAELKEVRFGFTTNIHDIVIRAKQVAKFLDKGYNVLVTIRLRGRELGARHLARKKLEEFLVKLEVPFTQDSEIKSQPRGWQVLLRKKL